MKIELRMGNVVKNVDSEDKAKLLENKGFVRTDGKTVQAMSPSEEVNDLKAQLVQAGEEIGAAYKRESELEKELEDTKAKLEEADKKIKALTQELDGTKEQLEAAVKKNKDANKK